MAIVCIKVLNKKTIDFYPINLIILRCPLYDAFTILMEVYVQ